MSNDDLERLEPSGWFTEDHLTDKSATTYSREVAERWKAKGWPVTPFYTGAAILADRQRRAQAAEPVAWSVMAPGGYLYESQFTTDRSVAEKWLSPNPENLLKLCPLYTRAAPVEVTEEMVERAAAAVFIANTGLPGVTWENESEENKELWRGSCRRALEAALGGGDV